jgi:trans-aconitate 2-methyltransferase
LWDAETYDAVSSIQEAWGRKVIEWRSWQGNETVMDAGCGTGRLTKVLAQKVPAGMNYAVDIDRNMIEVAARNLKDAGNVKFLESDISTAGLPAKVDVIFSNAAIHWILDHRKLFENFWQILDDKGEVMIQCGGRGNLEKIISILDEIRQRDEFKPFFAGWKESWYFAKPEDTSRLLQDIGFKNVQAYLMEDSATFANRNSFALFAKTVVMKPYLARLPDHQKDPFLKSFLDEIEAHHKSICWVMDYIRLNIRAIK